MFIIIFIRVSLNDATHNLPHSTFFNLFPRDYHCNYLPFLLLLAAAVALQLSFCYALLTLLFLPLIHFHISFYFAAAFCLTHFPLCEFSSSSALFFSLCVSLNYLKCTFFLAFIVGSRMLLTLQKAPRHLFTLHPFLASSSSVVFSLSTPFCLDLSVDAL